MANVRKVHIVTMSRLDDTNISFGISTDIDGGTCYFQQYPSSLLKHRREFHDFDRSLYLVLINNKYKNSEGFYKGSAFQNGRIVKESARFIDNTLVQRHYYIEYIGRHYDLLKTKPYEKRY